MKTFARSLTAVQAIALALGLIVSGLFLIQIALNLASQVEASNTVGNDYKSYVATSSASSGGTTSLAVLGTALGSVIISSTSPISVVGPIMAFYDTASATQSTTSMRAIAVMGAPGATTPPAGTYTFDIATARGLQMWINPAFAGSYVVTYR